MCPIAIPSRPAKQIDYSASKFAAKGRHELIMPRFVNLLSPARVLPVRWFDKLMNQLGVNNTMDHFVGRAEAKSKS